MDNPTILRLEEVNKDYMVFRSALHRFVRWLGFPVKPSQTFRAIDNLSLQMSRGETIGLIGQNGAGKSTLLKLITGTVIPSSGSIHVSGKISAILELGLGFNPEFTGRENVLHSGSLLGFSPSQIHDLMDEIEAFAEIGVHFDKPVRTYSSGMMARLAFSLATAVQPEILIVDEVLSVGDAYFQHKSFAKIREFRDNGVTIIIVSHSLPDIRKLCDKVILLENGKIQKQGRPDEVIDYYNAVIADKEDRKLSIEQRRLKNGWLHTEFGDGRAHMEQIVLERADTDAPVHLVNVGDRLRVRTKIKIIEDLDELVIGHRLSDRTGHVIWGTNTWHRGQVLKNLRAGEHVESVLEFDCDLGPGSYALHFGLHRDATHMENCYHKAENQIVFEVTNANKPFFIGTTHLEATFEARILESK